MAVKLNKLMWTAITAVLFQMMRSQNMSPADVASLKAQHIDPVTEAIDSDGDGVTDSADAQPFNPAVS